MELGLRQFWHDVRTRRYRFRQAVGVMFAAFLGVLAEPGWHGFALGTALCILGLAVRFWASGYIQKNHILETRGPYAFVRHPQYLGNCLVALGLCLAAGYIWAVVVWAVILCLFYLPAIKYEDYKLRRRFRDSWKKWGDKTPAIVPVHWPSGNPGLHVLDWSFRQSLRNGEPIWMTFVLLGLLSIFLRFV